MKRGLVFLMSVWLAYTPSASAQNGLPTGQQPPPRQDRDSCDRSKDPLTDPACLLPIVAGVAVTGLLIWGIVEATKKSSKAPVSP